MLLEKVRKAWDEYEVAGIYNQSEGNRKVFKRKVKEHYVAYGVDPMTLLILVQLAIRLYVWAKEQGFFKSIPSTGLTSLPGFDELTDSIDYSSVDDESSAEADDEDTQP